MTDDFEENQNEYIIDDELSDILNPNEEEYQDSNRMRRSIKTSQYQRIVQKKSIMFKDENTNPDNNKNVSRNVYDKVYKKDFINKKDEIKSIGILGENYYRLNK